MKNRKTQLTKMSKYVRDVVKKENPETVEQLVRLVQQEHGSSEQEIMNIIHHAGLRFTKHSTRPSNLKHYVTTTSARWYWFTIALCVLTATFVLILPEINLAVHIRHLLGSVFIFWMPGYCLVQSIFPGKKLEKLELIALSLGTSIVLVPMIAFVLHYTPWGIRTASVTIVLLILTLALANIAIFRAHQMASKR